MNNVQNNSLLVISGSGNATMNGMVTCDSIITTGSLGLIIQNGQSATASLSQIGELSCASITTAANITNVGSTFHVQTSGNLLTLKQAGDVYGEILLTLANRSAQMGIIASNTNTTYTMVDIGLQNAAATSLRAIRLESRTANSSTGQHSIQIGSAGAATLSIGDNYANVSNKLYVGAQSITNTTPADVLTVNGSSKLGSVACSSCASTGSVSGTDITTTGSGGLQIKTV